VIGRNSQIQKFNSKLWKNLTVRRILRTGSFLAGELCEILFPNVVLCMRNVKVAIFRYENEKKVSVRISLIYLSGFIKKLKEVLLCNYKFNIKFIVKIRFYTILSAFSSLDYMESSHQNFNDNHLHNFRYLFIFYRK